MKKFTMFFSALLFSMMSFAGVVTFDADADKGNAGTDSNNAAAYTISKSGVTVEVSQGILGTYNNEMHYRVYKNQTLKITSTAGNITSVQFTCTANGSEKYGPGCFTVDGGDYTNDGGAVGTWTGSATEITFTASANQVRATQIVVATDGAEIPETPETPENPENPETPENPEGVITCAEAVAICEATGATATTETYTIRGYVTEIKYAWSEQYGTATFWIADTKDGGNMLQAYSCAPLTDADKVFAVGAYVELVGKLKQYNTTNEVEKGTYTVITPADGGTTPPTPPTPPTNLVGEGTVENPYTVEDVLALNNTSKGPHYVKGFIIGQVNGASIQNGLDTEAPFVGSTNSDGTVATQGTNLMIAGVVGETTNIVAVQLPKGELRDAFNLVENPDMLGKEVLICGNLEKYFGVAGIKSPTSIEVIGGDNGEVVHVKDLPYADAYYVEEDGFAYWEVQLYNADEVAEEVILPIMAVGFEAKSKTALNGTYDLLLALYGTSVNEDTYEIEGVWNDESIAATLTIKNVDNENNYSFVGTFVGEDGKTYKINTVANVYAMEDATEVEIELKEEGNSDPVTPPAEGVITCAEAVAICEATGETSTTETYTIRGYVTEIKTAYSEQYGNISFWMADTPDGGKVLQGYRVKPVNEADINVAVGDYVEVVGTLVNFMSNTPEVNAGGTYTIITAGEDNNDPVTPPTPPTTDGVVTFDADVDQGNAGTDSNNATAYQITKSGVTMEVSSGILGTYNNEMHYRVYKNQTLTLTSTVGNIVKVEFTCTANDDAKYGPGCFTWSVGDYTYSGAVGTWTGNAAEIVFTASSNQVRATQVVVTLENANTGVEDVVTVEIPVKVIENGQLMIIRGENVYNVLGAQVK